VASGIFRDIIPACRETPVRDVLNQHTVSPTEEAAGQRGFVGMLVITQAASRFIRVFMCVFMARADLLW